MLLSAGYYSSMFLVLVIFLLFSVVQYGYLVVYIVSHSIVCFSLMFLVLLSVI